jgi:hypothetical protein
MPADDWALGQNLVDVRNEERRAAHGRTTQPSLLTALEPIDPRTLVDRIPGCDAPCICEPTRKDDCGWPFCGWKTHMRDET